MELHGSGLSSFRYGERKGKEFAFAADLRSDDDGGLLEIRRADVRSGAKSLNLKRIVQTPDQHR